MFTTDSRTEVFLTQMGVEYRYTNNVAMSDMSPTWDAKNLARPTPQREEAILEYAALMETGSPAPAPILAMSTEGYLVLDGIQRICAATIGGSTKISAYVVRTDSEDMLDTIRLLANLRLQGRQEPPDWTKRRVVEVLVGERHMSPEEVATLGGWKTSDIARLAKVIDFGFQICCIGGPQFPDSVVEVIASEASVDTLRKYPKVIASFCSVIKDGKFSADDAAPIVQEFFAKTAKPSHHLYDERLKEISERPELVARIKGRRTYTVPPDIRLRRALRGVMSIVDDLAEEPLYVDEFFKILRQITTKLKVLSSHNELPVTASTPADKWSSHEQD